MPLQSKCPHCGKVLTLKSQAAVGKKARCPGCAEPFVVKLMGRSKPDEEELEDDDWQSAVEESWQSDADEDEDEDYEEERPSRRSARSSSGSRSSSRGRKPVRKKRSSAGMPNWLKGVLIGAAALVVVGGLGFGLFKAVSGLSFGSNVIDLAWLPGDGDMYAQVKIREINSSPMIAQVKEQLQQNPMISNMLNQTGNEPWKLEDLDWMTMAGVDMADMVQRRSRPFGGAAGPAQVVKRADPKMMGVIYLSRALAETDLEAKYGAKTDVSGKGLFRDARSGQHYCLVEPQVVLFGNDEMIRAAISRGPKAPRVSRIDFMGGSHQIAFAMAPSTVIPEEVTVNGTTAEARLEQNLRKGMKAVSIGVSFNADLDVDVRFQCFKSGDAGAVKTELDAVLAGLKGKFDAQTAAVPAEMQQFVSIGKDTLQSIAASQNGSVVGVTGKVPGRVTAALQQAMSNPFMMMAMGAAMQQQNQARPPIMPPQSLGQIPPAGATGDPVNADIAAIQQQNQDAMNQLDQVRGQIRGATGAIGQSVPGGFVGKPVLFEATAGFNGQGDPNTVIRQVLISVPAVDQNSVQYDAETRRLSFRVTGSPVEASAALARAKFVLTEISIRPE